MLNLMIAEAIRTSAIEGKILNREAVMSSIRARPCLLRNHHPFEDGNGRIGRALAEKALSQGMGRPVVLSLSHAINAKRNAYYDALKNAQRSNEVTAWVHWFVAVVVQAQRDAEAQVRFVLWKSKFLQCYENRFNARQLKVVRRT